MKQSIVICAVLLGLASGAAPALANSQGIEYEMTIEGLDKKPVTLALDNWSWSAMAPEPDPSMPLQKSVQMQDIHLVVTQSPTTTMLLEAMLAKKVLGRVTIRIKQPNAHSFELVMKNAKISSFHTSGSSGGGRGWSQVPSEQMSMSFQTAKMTVKTAAGTHSAEIKK